MSMHKNTISGSMRPDGTRRKDIQIKPGYVNQDEVPKYVIPQRRNVPHYHISQMNPINTTAPGPFIQQILVPAIPVIINPMISGENMIEMPIPVVNNEKKRLKRLTNRQSKVKQELDNQQDLSLSNTPSSIDQLTSLMSSITINNNQTVQNSISPNNVGQSNINVDKELRKLRKKLRQIEKLEARQQNNDQTLQLNNDELTKLKSKKSIMERISHLECMEKVTYTSK